MQLKSGLIFSGQTETVNQILPHKNKWAWDLFLKGQANNWSPAEIPMQKDIEQWNSKDCLSDNEKLLVKRCLGFFAGSESLVSNNLLMSIFKVVSDAECRQYILRQAFEESLHNQTIVYICDSLNLDIDEVYEAYKNIPSIKAKDDFLMKITSDMSRNDFKIIPLPVRPEPFFESDNEQELNYYLKDLENYKINKNKTLVSYKEALKNIISYYIICEGIFFFSGFAMLLSFGRQNKLPGICEQIQYTLRDECVLEGTELLTPKGWKKIESLSYDDDVAQYNKDGSIEFVKPIQLSRNIQNKVYYIHNPENSVNLAVSENHRLITKNLNKRSENYLKPQEQSTKTFEYHPYVGHIISGNLKGNEDAFLFEERLLIAIQADGYICNNGYHNGNNCGYLQVKFNLSKKRKIERLKYLLSNVNWEYKNKDGDFTLNVPIKYCTKEFCNWVDLKNKSSNWCKEFICEVTKWDGWQRKDSGSFGYGSTNKQNIDIVQAIASLCGYKTNIVISVDNRKESYKDYYRLSLIPESDFRRGNTICKVVKERENTNFYGIQIPSGMILVRYNNCISVTGNSLHIEFGTKLINTIIEQNSDIWTDKFKTELQLDTAIAVNLEIDYAKDTLPEGILGLNSSMFIDYVQYIANRRLSGVGLTPLYKNARNPFSWMTETIDLYKNKNYFERKVTEYSVGTLKDDF